MSEPIRLAQVLGALSLATDLSAGQTPESALSATILAVRLARAMDLDQKELIDTYYTCITRFIGCTSSAESVAAVTLGDELSANLAFSIADPADPVSVRAEMLRHFATEAPLEQREGVIDMLLSVLSELPYYAIPHCEQAIALASRLPVPADVPALLSNLESRWDGRNPTRLGGEEVPQVARIVEFAVVAELHRRAGGLVSMLEIARHRAGGQFDPAVCALFVKQAPELLDGFAQHSNWELYLESEPGGEPCLLQAHELQTVAEAFADFTDNKSGWLVGHSRHVAALSYRAAEALGFPQPQCHATFIAALLHDTGRSAIPNGVWDKPGELSTMEQRQMHTHCLHTENVLSLSPVFEPIIEMACSTQERSDGSGYHRRTRLEDSRSALLAVANMYDALTHDRPWRDAHSEEQAADMLLEEATTGRLPRDQVRAVLEAAGHSKRVTDKVYPGGLSKREAEVLEQLARGLTNKEIGERLSIAPKTVDNHVQNLYTKIGANSRTAAAMYAYEQGIFTK